MPLRAILFDIDDTLFATTQFAQRARRRAVQAMVHAGLLVDEDVAYRELKQVVEEFSSNYGHHFDKLVLRLSEHIRPGVHPAIVIASGVQAYHSTKEHIRAYPDAARVLHRLMGSDLKRAILSNGFTVKQAEKLVRLGLQNAFSPGAIFISEEIGVAKPHPKIFRIACESLEVSPDEAMYVGDHPLKDVDPAHDAGLITVLRRGTGKYADKKSVHAPDHELDSLDELVPILADRYGIDLPD
ncbi:MAG: TIGR02253 family HAD-type hydrolase [Planctomycetota bacterium]|nr:TIGR02253 family HAD-type hydrolase [Planctomycetota bacterium]